MKDPITLRVLQIARDKFGWNQVEFGKALGVEKSNVTNWLARSMPATMQIRSAKLLGVSIDHIVGGTGAAAVSRAQEQETSNRIAEETLPYHGYLLTEADARLAAEIAKLSPSVKSQVQSMVETLVAEQVRQATKPVPPKTPPRAPKSRGRGVRATRQ